MNACIKCGHDFSHHDVMTMTCMACGRCCAVGTKGMFADFSKMTLTPKTGKPWFFGKPLSLDADLEAEMQAFKNMKPKKTYSFPEPLPDHPYLKPPIMSEEFAKHLDEIKKAVGPGHNVYGVPKEPPKTALQQMWLDQMHAAYVKNHGAPTLPPTFLCPAKPPRERKHPMSCERGGVGNCRGVRWAESLADDTLISRVWCPECGHGEEPHDELVRLNCMLAAEVVYGPTPATKARIREWIAA